MTTRPKKSATSPAKRTSAVSASQLVNQQDYARLTNKEVEIEHLKSSLYAVSSRLQVLKDMERDVQSSQALVHDSEQKRVQLQQHIQQTAGKMHDEAIKNKTYQDELIRDNRQLQDEVARIKGDYDRLERSKAELQVAHLREIQDINT